MADDNRWRFNLVEITGAISVTAMLTLYPHTTFQTKAEALALRTEVNERIHQNETDLKEINNKLNEIRETLVFIKTRFGR